MTPLAALIREEIAQKGPISFRRFMECALYHSEYGYYRRERDPFGKEGDFYTAEQLQPVFGTLVAWRIRELFCEMGSPSGFTVVELGAGRGEMAPFFSEWPYVPVEIERSALPERLCGVVFSNEFFDALPVDVAVRRADGCHEMLIGWNGRRFAWIEGDLVSADAANYIARYIDPGEDGQVIELNFDALRWIERIAATLDTGFVLTIDYGYTRRESVRFPAGTLMSYQRHTALEDVLEAPGERDITAHVPFTALAEHGEACGLETVSLETLAHMLLDVGERGAFESLVSSERTRMQLKTLLFGMGETFRVLLGKKRRVGTK